MPYGCPQGSLCRLYSEITEGVDMELEIMVPRKIDAAFLEIRADVRYWENAKVNGTEGGDMPLRIGDSWCPVIDMATGRICGWPKGTTASVYFKVCDCGEYWLQDSEGKRVAKFSGDYVPHWACPGGDGYGDYIIMDIGEGGVVEKWAVDADDLDDGGLAEPD